MPEGNTQWKLVAKEERWKKVIEVAGHLLEENHIHLGNSGHFEMLISGKPSNLSEDVGTMTHVLP